MQEKATLLAMKSGFAMLSPGLLADWNESNADVCGFTGVACDRRRQHVVSLKLTNMSIGAIPPALGRLSYLRYLDLSDNHISGAIPPFVGNLTQLRDLSMSANQLSDAIPASFGNLTSLVNLDLSGNFLRGEIPAELSNIRDLADLNLSQNQLVGAIPPSLGNLTQLKGLDLSNNNLTGRIPGELSNIRVLEALNLGQNHLVGGIPPSFTELARMFYLSLEKNNLSGTIPAAIFTNCTDMGVFDLGDNNISGEIPGDASPNLAETFAVLNLYSNRLTGRLPRWLANCTILYLLDVENNSLEDELPTAMISGKKNLTYLHLSYNVRFTSGDGNTNLEPFFRAVSNCSSILEIEAASLKIRGRLPSLLGWLLPPNMSHLNLELNAIEGPIPADIGDVINITLMNLSSNLLNGTIPESICRLKKLQQLALSNNWLTGPVPACIGDAASLGELELASNALSGNIPSSIGSLTLLLYLSLRGNQLSGEIPASLGRCGGILRLDLSGNRLTGEIPDVVAGIAKRSLNLSHNLLAGSLPRGLSMLQQAEVVDLSWNNLTGTIFPELGGCAELQVLDLSHNSLTGVLPSSLDGLQSIERLDVSDNSLTGEIPSTLTKCTTLTYLNLSYNDFAGVVPTTGVFTRFNSTSYLGNPRLCGAVVRRRCGRHHRWYQSRKFLAVMCICAAVLAFALTILCAVSIRKIRERLAVVREEFRRGRRGGGGSSPVMKYKFPRITYRELVEATEEFSPDRLVGTGSYGRVYRGTLRDGTMVAVKVLQLQSGNSTKSFNRECQVLKRIRHRNLMRIVTACSLPDFKALVLPFMANGSLERCLYAGPPAELSLVQRVNICSDIAEGMAYLHHHSPVKVIHCDLKPSNVLINDDMTALVSDFGISRLVMSVGGVANAADVGASTANMLCGSIGYIPPEYGYGSNPTTKGDVYSFGVLVLEMVTRKKPTDDMFDAGLSLHKWVKSHHHGRADAVGDQAPGRRWRAWSGTRRRRSRGCPTWPSASCWSSASSAPRRARPCARP
uniref:non-specific serine/threonine protein kinase n=1 Tax=Oryza brachyantha TaxID=4533 RepID=J3MXK5_ORYBR